MPTPERKRGTGLVLGAGGVLGGAWSAGALHALALRTGWYPFRADRIVGTSAGSVLAALGAAGVPPWLLVPEASAGVFHGFVNPGGDLEIAGDLWGRIVRHRRVGLPGLWPGSLGMTMAALRGGGPTGFLRVLSGLAPHGFMSTDPIKETVEWTAPSGWVGHPSCWIVACDYLSGERTVFGRDDAPTATIAQAVAASCAIPGFYQPERIGGRLYVDGGLHSMSNLDLVAHLGLEQVICLNPLSARGAPQGWDPMGLLTGATRRAVAEQLDTEVAALRADGVEVLVLEPGPEDIEAMGSNLMDDRRRHDVLTVATRSTAARLEAPEAAGIVRRLASRPSDPMDVAAAS